MELTQVINSGLLELYVIGDLSEQEHSKIEQVLELHPELRKELEKIEKAFENYAFQHAAVVDPTAKPMLLAGINYAERLENGEIPVSPPMLGTHSKVSDFDPWLSRPDLQEPSEYEEMCGRIIGSDEEKTTMIVWLKEGAPPEVHTDELEKFLIVEGSCDITIGEKVHHLQPGSYLEIPLHIVHSVKVTSQRPCKIILERCAA